MRRLKWRMASTWRMTLEDDTNEIEDDNSQHPTQAKEVRRRFTPEEDTILVKLRNNSWVWKNIAYELKGRHSVRSLRTHYWKKAMERCAGSVG
jgi:hypothetical protein